jgi:hypothetical protein
MSALTYTIDSLLVGKSYRSKSRGIEGEIKEATPHDAWYGNEYQAYRILVRPTYTGVSISPNRWKDFYAVVAVKVMG